MAPRGTARMYMYINLLVLYKTVYGFLLNSSTESLNETLLSAATTSVPSADSPEYLTRLRWADSAFTYIKSLNCTEVYFTSPRECNHMLNVRKRNVVVYIAQEEDSIDGEFVAMLPDSGLSRAGTHHGVVALDPHPDANFGHLVIVFFIDKVDSQADCERTKGTYIGNDECMKLALKHRCRNAIERHRRYNTDADLISSSRQARKMVRRCEINFLPLVHKQTSQEPAVVDGISQGYEQALVCREDLLDYSLCPSLRPSNETLNLVCNPIRDNTRRCETSHEAVGTRCEQFESCDQAVLISGGWNRQTSLTRHSENIVNMYQLLRRNGFQQSSIKIFFANGMHRGIQEETGAESVNTEIFPAAMKTSMRFHIRKLCGRPHCVDTLVLYLNSPSRTDGTMLLWDVNKNGKVEADEQYTIDELLDDIKSCKARSVQIIADQSFSGELSKAVRKSNDHSNVLAFSSGKENEYSYMSTFTDYWTRLDHSHICTEDVFQQIKNTMLKSTPDFGAKGHDNEGPGPLTIFGAPCNVDPPFSANELRLWYRGCQNVPTEVWLRTFFSVQSASANNDNAASQLPTSSADNANTVQQESHIEESLAVT